MQRPAGGLPKELQGITQSLFHSRGLFRLPCLRSLARRNDLFKMRRKEILETGGFYLEVCRLRIQNKGTRWHHFPGH